MNGRRKSTEKSKPYSENRVILSRGVRLFVFTFLLLDTSAINIASGLLSSASKDIKTSMSLNDKQFGMFGTSMGIGRIIGSMLFITLINVANRKWLFVLTLLAKSISLILFALFNNVLVMIGIRCLMGALQVPLMIYIPIWIDQFGIQIYKTFFMTMTFVATPTGKVLGYLFHILLGSKHWKYGLVFESAFLFLSFALLAFCPGRYFSRRLMIVKDKDREYVEKMEHKVVSIFEVNQISQKDSKGSFVGDLREIMCVPVFLCCLFIRAILFGVNTAIQYWIGDYMRTVLLMEGGQIFFSYTIIAVSGPLGGLFAGSIINFFIGGYENKHSSLALLFSHTLACICGLMSPFFKSSYVYCLLTTFYFVFNSVALPLIQGIILTSVKPQSKGTAFSIANFSTMLLTSGPFPFLYGAINDAFKASYPWMAMLSVMFVCSLGVIPMLFMCFFRYRTFAIDSMERLVDFDKSIGRSTADNKQSAESNEEEEDIELQKRG